MGLARVRVGSLAVPPGTPKAAWMLMSVTSGKAGSVRSAGPEMSATALTLLETDFRAPTSEPADRSTVPRSDARCPPALVPKVAIRSGSIRSFLALDRR